MSILGCGYARNTQRNNVRFLLRTATSMFSLLLYCPEQAPMGARNSSAKNWRWAVTLRTYLNGSTIPTQGPTPDAKLAAMGLNRLASSVRPWFVEACPTVEKAVSYYKADQLVASMLSFRSVQSLLPVWEFACHGHLQHIQHYTYHLYIPQMQQVAAYW